MGSIVVHAGRPKAGSTSIQAFLAANASELRRRGIDVVVPAPGTPGSSRLELEPVESPTDGTVSPARANAGSLHQRLRAASAPEGVLRDLIDALSARARVHDVVVVSGEALSLFVAGGHPGFLGALATLADRHPVHVAYYVRAQHDELEAQWCHAWRTDPDGPQSRPSALVRVRASWVHHDRTTDLVAELAPGVDLAIRPLVPEVLRGGDVVTDFATGLLGDAGAEVLAAAPPGRRWNPTLPLELVNALRVELPGRFLPSPVTDAQVRRLRRRTWWRDLAPSPEAARGRLVLQRWCRAELEPGNQRLIAAHGWPVDHLVPPVPDDAAGGTDLGALDELWCPRPSARTAGLAARVLASIEGDETT